MAKEQHKLFYVSLNRGGRGIKAARTLDSARMQVEREQGEWSVREIRPATAQDVAWVRGMGGHIPSVGSPFEEDQNGPRH